MSPATRRCVLVLGAGAPWEADLLPRLDRAGMVVLRRCVDLVDLLAAATTGQADTAVVAVDRIDLDTEAVDLLTRHGIAVLAVLPDGGDRVDGAGGVGDADPIEVERLERIGVGAVTGPASIIAAIADLAAPAPRATVVPGPAPVGGGSTGERPGPITVVWGPRGAPGRSTVAVGIAAAAAAYGHPMVLVDADPGGAALGHHLGVLDEVSGLLGAARAAHRGDLDRGVLTDLLRRVEPDLYLLSGLPRADRRVEIRPGTLHRVLAVAAGRGGVVVDTGDTLDGGGADPFGDPDGWGAGDDRTGDPATMTRDALTAADRVVVVGSSEPLALTRLARALTDLAEFLPGVRPHVVVNRMRASLGWHDDDVIGMVGDYIEPAAVHLVPYDRVTMDRAAALGRSLLELGDSPVRRAFDALADRLYTLNSR